jgi:hypothetical protein
VMRAGASERTYLHGFSRCVSDKEEPWSACGQPDFVAQISIPCMASTPATLLSGPLNRAAWSCDGSFFLCSSFHECIVSRRDPRTEGLTAGEGRSYYKTRCACCISMW